MGVWRSHLGNWSFEFHHHVGARIRTSPGVGASDDLERCAFIEEEAQELRDAVGANDLTGIADALADLAYVVYGAALHFGIDLDAAVREVHRSNMTKTPAGEGKATKGPEYSPPDLGHLTSAPDGRHAIDHTRVPSRGSDSADA